MNVRFDMRGRHVVVAGGTRGINLGIAKAFAQAGAAVGVFSRDGERVREAERTLAVHGHGAFGAVADVRDAASVEQALAGSHARFGPIDVLVSGAAGNFLAAALQMSPNAFRTVVDIDLNGSFNVMRVGHVFLRRPGASVLHISAPQSFNPAPLQAHACAAKAGLDQLMRVLAMEWGPHGIRVNSIAPGPIADTEGVQRLVPADERAAMACRLPLQRMGRIDDIAQVALFLASDAAAFITGALIPVDGGAALLGARHHAGMVDLRSLPQAALPPTPAPAAPQPAPAP